jgi:glycosyltransferase involved in cell wall biosynthesis
MCQVSIIIPLYNKGHYICRALNSIFDQSFQNFEIIVVDDGSTDDCADLAMVYNDPRLQMIRQTNAGPGAARNRGIGEAKGKYIAFLDADDEWLPEFLSKSVRILENHSDCDVCISAWYQDFVRGVKFSKETNIVDSYKNVGINLNGGPVSFQLCERHKYLLLLWWTGTVLIRNEVFKYNYRFYGTSKHTYGEDNFLWIQLAFNHTFYRNLEPLAWYHNEASDLSRGGYTESLLEAFLLWPEEIIANSKAANRKAIRKWLANYAIVSAHNRLGVGQFNNAITLIKKFPEMAYVNPLRFQFLMLKIVLFKFGIYKPCR